MSNFCRPESVGQGLITVLQQGHHGSIWVCEDNGLVYEIEISTLEDAKKDSQQQMAQDNWSLLNLLTEIM